MIVSEHIHVTEPPFATLLFLDEFDTAESNYALLLPLLWDGEITLGQRELKVAKIVIVLAGSRPELPKTMERAKRMSQKKESGEDAHSKLPDLLSRINGGIFQIPLFFDPTQNIDRRVDKVCIAVQLLRRRFGGKTLKTVPLSLLRFIAQADFRYSVRSISHLVDLMPHGKDVIDLEIKDLNLPFDNLQGASGQQFSLPPTPQRSGCGNAAFMATGQFHKLEFTGANEVN